MKKILSIILISVFAIIVIAAHVALAWFIYTTFFTTTQQQESQSQQQVSLEKDVLSEIQKSAEESGAWSNYIVTQQAEVDKNGGTFVYKATELSSGPLGVEPTASLRITRADASAFDTNSLEDVETTMTTALQANDVIPFEVSTPPEVLSSYQGQEITCSLNGTLGASYVTLSCVTDEALKDAIQTVQELVGLQGSAIEPAAYVQCKAVYSGDDQHAVATVDVFSEVNLKSHSYVYTRDDITWAYVDDALAAQPGTTGGGKVKATPKIEELLQDATYGALYLNLLGTKD